MEFWGVEVKPGKPFPVVPDGDKILHLSQATLGEVKKYKANESVTIFVNIGGQKLVLGILSPEKFPQLAFDLVFEKEFELSHNCKNGSVYFCGYQTYGPEEGDEFSGLESDDEEEEEDLPQVNGKLVPVAAKAKAPVPKASAAKPDSSEKKKVKLVDPSKDSKDDGSDDDDDESGEEDSDDESNDYMLAASDEDDDDDDESDDEEEDEETPKKKAEASKKRVNDSANKTPVPSKKAKSETPQKSDGKKTVHVATPHPNKNVGKTPVSNKSKTQSPKSGGQFSCEPCKKSFNSDKGLESHNKAKHVAK